MPSLRIRSSHNCSSVVVSAHVGLTYQLSSTPAMAVWSLTTRLVFPMGMELISSKGWPEHWRTIWGILKELPLISFWTLSRWEVSVSVFLMKWLETEHWFYKISKRLPGRVIWLASTNRRWFVGLFVVVAAAAVGLNGNKFISCLLS